MPSDYPLFWVQDAYAQMSFGNEIRKKKEYLLLTCYYPVPAWATFFVSYSFKNNRTIREETSSCVQASNVVL